MNQDSRSTTMDDQDRTIVRPSPGGRRGQIPVTAPMYSIGERTIERDFQIQAKTTSNPLCARAFDLISLVPKLKSLPFHHTINELLEQLINQFKSFEKHALQEGILQEHVRIAGYFICSLIDETILNTPWGKQSNWGHHGLLITFYNEAQGGTRFFQMLKQLTEHPEPNLNLLELAYLCLSFGFEGKYRLITDGLRDLEQQRRDLYLLIQRIKGEGERELSLYRQGLHDKRSPLMRHVPLWVVFAVTGSLLIFIYLGFAYSINRASDHVFKRLMEIASIRGKSAPVVLEKPVMDTSISQSIDRFKEILAEDIAQNRVKVISGPTLRIFNAFASGSERISRDYLPMLARIANELKKDSTQLTVVGHTDNRPIFSARFQSNWHLSYERAKDVAGILTSYAWLKDRVSFEGRADGEPVAPNDTPSNRAINRRIDIHVR